MTVFHYIKMPIKHCTAMYRLTALKRADALAAGPLDSRSCMAVKTQVVAVNTMPPAMASFKASPRVAYALTKGSKPNTRAEKTGMQI